PSAHPHPDHHSFPTRRPSDLTETDLTICGYQTAQKKIRPQQANHYEAKTLRQHIGNLYEQMLLQSPCNKLYRRSHILKHLITFPDRKSTRLNSSHVSISYAVF